MLKHTQGEECEKCNEMLLRARDELRNFFLHFKKQFIMMHVSCVYRDEEDQNAAFLANTSKLKWPKSKHNKLPSEAIDVFEILPNGSGRWDPAFYHKLNEIQLVQGFNLEWGGSWKVLRDGPHFQIRDAA